MIIDGNKFIQFELMEDSGKTQGWIVVNKSNGFNLGLIEWYEGWRKYTFQPSEYVEFDSTCLDVISKFLTRLDKEKRIVEQVKS